MIIEIDTLLSWGATYKKVGTGEIIFKEGNKSSFYYQLVSGSVRWINIDEEGRELIQYLVEPGESFGELPLFDGEPFAATAIADKESVIIRLHKPVFLEMLKENPTLHFAFSALLSKRIRFKMFLINEMAHHSPEHFITALIKYFKDSKSNVCGTCNQLQLTRQQLADMTGMRVETVIRTMRSMHDKGQLHINKGKVYC